ncbi:MAG: hypothetical protein KAU50_00410 [Candidatus Marinimicrobia bacterium]|nr:hypothetical protein [Candidatus Neomarinimicrobiota bacterium]
MKWRVVETIVKQNGIEVIAGKRGSKKKLKKRIGNSNRVTIIHAHDGGSEIEPCYVNQIIDKFEKDEAEFFG